MTKKTTAERSTLLVRLNETGGKIATGATQIATGQSTPPIAILPTAIFPLTLYLFPLLHQSWSGHVGSPDIEPPGHCQKFVRSTKQQNRVFFAARLDVKLMKCQRRYLKGGLAHMVERVLCKHEAKGSIPLISKLSFLDFVFCCFCSRFWFVSFCFRLSFARFVEFGSRMHNKTCRFN